MIDLRRFSTCITTATMTVSEDVQLERVRVASLFVESILYGVYLISFAFAMRYLLVDAAGVTIRRGIHWTMVIITLLLFGLASVDECLGLVRVLRLDVHFPPTGVDSMLSIVIFLVIVLVDGILVYRCWIVYLRSWVVIILPGILWLGTFASTILHLYNIVHLHVGSPVNTPRLEKTLKAILTLTIVQNILSTALIAWRIWHIDRQSSPYRVHNGRTQLQMISKIVVESGLLCTLSATCSYISFWTSKRYAGEIASDAQTQLISIAFNLIIIRTANQSRNEYVFRNTVPSQGLQLSFRPPTIANVSSTNDDDDESPVPRKGRELSV